MGKESKRSVLLSRELLVKLKLKKQMPMQRKQGLVTWDKAQLCRDGVWKAKAKLELNMARDIKNNRKGFYR